MKGENYLNQTLLVIDAQQEIIDGNQEEKAVFNKEQLIKNLNLLIKKGDRIASLCFICKASRSCRR